MSYLLDGEQGQIIERGKRQETKRKPARAGKGRQAVDKEQTEERKEPKEPKKLKPPEKNQTMKRVYAYLLQKRHIDREILSYFAKAGTIYESAEHHNIVFAGLDSEGKIRHVHVKGSCSDGRSFRLNQEGNPRHIHKKGTCSDGRSFRMNEDGSDSSYGFGYAGAGNKLYVFEAPIDLLSFLSLYPDNWQENSYITLNGVAEHAMLQALKDNPRLDTVVLCLDHDPAGIEACGRLAEILARNGYGAVKQLQSACKDWNEDLKGRYGEKTIPAQEHPRVMECRAWTEVLKEVTESINIKYANRSYICRYYQDIYNELKKGRGREQLTDAFDGPGMLLTGVLVRCMEKEGIALGRETSADQILENLSKRYQPHKDKGNFNTRIRQMQAAFEETLEVFDTKDLEQKEDQELLARKCMSLAMECIRAHIFVAIDCGEEQMKPAKQNVKEQKVEHQEGGMMLCSQS